VRVMVEAPTRDECRQICGRLVAAITEDLT
jgi:hypothetical protein